MEKIIILSKRIIGSFLMITIFISCSKDEKDLLDDDLQLQMINIENSIYQNQFSSEFISMELSNTKFFDKLTEIKNVKNQQEMDNKLLELSNYSVSFSKFTNETSGKGNTTTSANEEIIYRSLYNSLKHRNKNSIAIISFYINEISCLKINKDLKKRCLDNLQFFKDVLIFYNFDLSEETIMNNSDTNKGQNAEVKPKWHCLYRDCFDCCMNAKLYALSQGNLIEFIEFMISPPINTAWMVASCGFDCIFNNSK